MRKTRYKVKGSWYHVTAKANLGEGIFEEDHLKFLMMYSMGETQKKYKFISDNLVIMDNHFHIKIKPEEGVDISRIMQSMLCRFAKIFNNAMGRKGHVFYDRFHSVVIENKEQEINVFNYIANNPVKAGIVNKPEDYKYNGIRFIKEKIFDLLTPPEPFLLINYFWQNN